MPVRIDREAFLALTAALAGCAPAVPAPRAPAPTANYDTTASSGGSVTVPQPTPAATGTEELVEEVHTAESASGPACSNDEGDVSCDFVDARFDGPACEGFAGSCQLLQRGYGYRPRVAAAIARCWDKRGRAACNMRVKQQCIREAFQEACPDPAFNEFCASAEQRCKDAGKRPDFGVDECVRAMSSIEGRELEWAKGATGSPSREGCRLMFPVY